MAAYGEIRMAAVSSLRPIVGGVHNNGACPAVTTSWLESKLASHGRTRVHGLLSSRDARQASSTA